MLVYKTCVLEPPVRKTWKHQSASRLAATYHSHNLLTLPSANVRYSQWYFVFTHLKLQQCDGSLKTNNIFVELQPHCSMGGGCFANSLVSVFSTATTTKTTPTRNLQSCLRPAWHYHLKRLPAGGRRRHRGHQAKHTWRRGRRAAAHQESIGYLLVHG